MVEIESRDGPDDRQRRETGVIPLPEFVFDPKDDWTRVFQKGLSRLPLSRKTVYEVGLGSGSNAAFLLNHCAVSRVVGSDIDPRVVDVAQANVKRWAPDKFGAFAPISGSVDLLDSEEARAAATNADVIIGSIPQIIDVGAGNRCVSGRHEENAVGSAEQRLPDHIAHYYDGTRFEHYPFNVIGQGLNEGLLKQARNTAPKADIVLILSGRVGATLLLQLFRQNGYRPEIVYDEVIPQCPKTSISFFVELEATLKDSDRFRDFVCCFFGDPGGSEKLSAARAEQRRNANGAARSVYHRLYVVRGSHEHES